MIFSRLKHGSLIRSSSLLLLLLFHSCDWFNPREAETPQEEESDWQEPFNPSAVLSNLERAFEDRNIINYGASLTSNFEFFGDLSDSLYVNPGSFQDWFYDVEINVATKLFNTFSNIELFFEDSLKDSTGAEANFYELYTINLESLDSSVIVAGLVHFRLTLDSLNLWGIEEWTDFRTDTLYIDWGILKAKNR
jgi:hypothetical protein